MKIGASARNAAVNAITALLNSGTIQIRTDAAPTNPSDDDAGTLLATLGFGATAFGNASNGVATANAISDDTSADATGTAGHFRAKSSGDVVILQGSVGTGGADMNFDTTSFVAGGVVKITSMTLTMPES